LVWLYFFSFVTFFFFQAEDGIRDFHVTGVQTCALPISLRVGEVRTDGRDGHGRCWLPGGWLWRGCEVPVPVITNRCPWIMLLLRSEERRVGKGCRSWVGELREEKKRSARFAREQDRYTD